MWLQIPHFLNLIRGFWSKLQFFGYPQFVLASKLCALKVMLKSWNISLVSDVHSRVAGSRAILDVVQEEISSLGPAEDRFLREQYAHTRFLFYLSLQLTFLRDKARVRWLVDGGQNTSFLHNMV